jgi:hypothetical protein
MVAELQQRINSLNGRVYEIRILYNNICNMIGLSHYDVLVREAEDEEEEYRVLDHAGEVAGMLPTHQAATNCLLVPRADRGWALGPSHDGLPRFPSLLAQQGQHPITERATTPTAGTKHKDLSLDNDNQIGGASRIPRSVCQSYDGLLEVEDETELQSKRRKV